MRYLIINPKDNVGVALADLRAGEAVAGSGALRVGQAQHTGIKVELVQDIPAGHKFALADIPEGGQVYKYGCPIGSATCGIRAGEHVHVHNIRTNLKDITDYTYEPVYEDAGAAADDSRQDLNAGAAADDSRQDLNAGAAADTSRRGSGAAAGGRAEKYFMGYAREDGAVGTRNEIWILPTVGCVNKTAERLAEIGRRMFKDTYAFTHPYGCSQVGGDQLRVQRQLANLAMHPNAGGVLVVGLGCENNNIEDFKRVLAGGHKGSEKMFGGRVRFVNAQDCADELAEGAALLGALAATAATRARAPAPISKLRVGLKCGGSDGFSGITANPLTGAVSDMVVRAGGATILTEVPEMFGAEHLLMNRCADRELFEKTVSLINDYKRYFIRHGQDIYENRSPGNKDGGLSTPEDKSLGCTQKGGGSPVRAVLRYGETVSEGGLNLLEGPGNDLVAITGLTCAGAQLILFTTGRGTPVGAPVPTLKISTNSRLAAAKPGWIDFDAGRMLTYNDGVSLLTYNDGVSLPANTGCVPGGMDSRFGALPDELFDAVIALASGEYEAKNELNGYREIALFKDGVVL